ncbi:damage inducible DinF protein [Streptococcus pneumoniae]|nr:damage inducible DinF protein [Streptococcus pneumoniae]VQD90602.1 damage inducible DinF protein [Streptococcus pneumoniae]VQV26490.1 damage inducible DinF protein [Streptococcus pneumoniae]VSU79108.1 damage inducible DinF protein [Streptococcus pneumoniae]HEU9872138.1 MATE family efflux transporter [Streptococcus pneumoniae]
MNKKRTVDLIHGPILPSLLSFTFPILLSNIFQQLYNTADVLIVGRFLGQESLAAVGATTAIFDLIVGFTLGVGNGMGIVIARYYGARNFTKIKEAVAATWILGALLSILVMLLGFLGLYHLLQYLDTPAEILPQSYQYISMIVTCVGVSFAYNLFAGLLRSIGDSLAALGFLIFSALVNVVLDLYFITQLHLGVQSAGLATIISQGLSAVLCFYYIRKSVPELLPQFKHFKWDKSLYADLLEQGLAMGLMSSIVSIGSVILQFSVNTFGAVIISAQTAARRIMTFALLPMTAISASMTTFALLPMTAISASMTTFASQNLGAKRPDRIVQGLRIGSRLSISWAVFVCIFLFFASPALVSFLASSTDGYLIENGSLYLQISSAFYPILSLLLIYRNCLQGLGQKILPLVSSFIELIGKIVFVVLIIPWAGYKGVILCEPLIWVAMTVQLYFSLFRHPLIKEGKAILATKVQS